MEMELDGHSELNQTFFDLHEPETFNFEFEPEYNVANDPFTIKQEAYSPEDTLFDTPSASPLPVVPDETLVFSPVPLEIESNGDDVLFEDVASSDANYNGIVLDNMDDSSLASQSPEGVYSESRDSDSDVQAKRGRKRKAPATANEKRAKMRFDPGHVIPKDQLPKMSAEELEEYAQHIQESTLSTGEKNEIRKQLRLVKNRESAQASRLRKKNYIDDLEHRVSLLQSENSNLRQNVSSLHNENTQLKSEVVYLKGVVNNGGLSKVLSQGATFFSKLSQQQQQQQQNGGKPAGSAITARSAGVVLMVVLFSVGLMFNAQGIANNALPFKSAVHEAKPGRVLNHANYKPTSEVRNPLAVFEQTDAPTQRIRDLVEKQRAMPNSDSHMILEERPAPKQLDVPAAPAAPAKESHDEPLVSDWKPNTTYLLCPEVQKLTPPTDIKSDPTLPTQISFLIPSQSLAVGAGDSASGAGRDSLLEVTCRVVDVTSRPYTALKSS